MDKEGEGRGRVSHTESVASTSYEKAVEKLNDKIKGLETETPQYQAFADLADFNYSHFMCEFSKDEHGKNPDIERVMEKAAIWETIRQRKNEPTGFKGYNAAHREFQAELGRLLDHPEIKDLPQLARDNKVFADLREIKK